MIALKINDFQILGSPVEEDECGICGGDGSKCKSRQKSFERRSVAKIGHSKLMILPAGARNLEIAFHSSHNVSIALKERQTNLIVHEGHHNRHRLRNDDHHSLKTTFVTEGTKFTYETTSDNDYLYGRGPLLAPIVVLASSDKIGVAFSLNVSYTVSRLNDPLFSLQKHEWVIKGWSKCSKECGGGHQRLILRFLYFSTKSICNYKVCFLAALINPLVGGLGRNFAVLKAQDQLEKGGNATPFPVTLNGLLTAGNNALILVVLKD